MADREQDRDEVVVSFDYDGDSLVLSGQDDDELVPGAHPGEARVEVDPLVEEYSRNPYDPVLGAMMMGRATGEVIARPPRIVWMRVLAYLLALTMIAQCFTWIYLVAIDGDDILARAATSSTAFSLALGAGGVLLLVRLLRRSGRVDGQRR